MSQSSSLYILSRDMLIWIYKLFVFWTSFGLKTWKKSLTWYPFSPADAQSMKFSAWLTIYCLLTCQRITVSRVQLFKIKSLLSESSFLVWWWILKWDRKVRVEYHALGKILVKYEVLIEILCESAEIIQQV